MLEPSLTTIKRLFAFSGNRCAFPGCGLPIVEDGGVVTGIICHIKARSKGGPRYDPEQTPEQRHGCDNLVLMCARHSKLIDSEPKTFTAERIYEMKREREKAGSLELSQSDALKAAALQKEYRSVYITAGGNVMLNSPGAVQAVNVTIRGARTKPKFLPIQGSLGADLLRRNYARHLIDRYNEFASKQRGRRKFTFAAIYAHIKKHFKADWDRIPLGRFDELVGLLQDRIDRTQLGRINQSKGTKNYSPFAEFAETHAAAQHEGRSSE